MPKYQEVIPAATTTESPRKHSPTEGAFVATLSIILGGALVVIGLVVAGVLAIGVLAVAFGAVVIIAAFPWLMMAVGGTARAGFYMLEQVSRRDINYDGAVGNPEPAQENIRLIPFHHWQDPIIKQSGEDNGINRRDLAWLVGRLDNKEQTGWTERELLGKQMPSGLMVDRDTYDAYIAILVQNGFLVGRSERSKGRLLAGPDAIFERLGM